MYSFSSWVFIALTCVYFWLKYRSNKATCIEMVNNNTPITTTTINISPLLIIYFLLYFVAVFSVSFSDALVTLTGTCPENTMNYGSALISCFCGWGAIFLVMVGVICFTSSKNLNMAAGFGDILGNPFVSKQMNDIFSTIMYPTSELKSKMDEENSKELVKAAEAIMKTTNSYLLLVNKFTPYNFLDMWDNITPLMKSNENIDKYKEELLYFVLLRNSIGEFFWYIYTGVFVCSFVSFLVLKNNCVTSIKELDSKMFDIPEPNNGGPKTSYVDYDGKNKL